MQEDYYNSEKKKFSEAQSMWTFLVALVLGIIILLVMLLTTCVKAQGQCPTTPQPEKTFFATDQWGGGLPSVGAGYSVGFISASFFYHGIQSNHMIKGGLTAFGVCIGKELFDCVKKNPTGFSYKDLTYDSMGVLLGLWTHYMFEKYSYCKGRGRFSLFSYQEFKGISLTVKK